MLMLEDISARRNGGKYRNLLLAQLPPGELSLLEPHFETRELKQRALFYDAMKPIEDVHFMEDGIASILSVLADGSAVETATLGYEGMVGLPVFHGVTSTPEQAMVQAPARAVCLPASKFRELLPQLPTLTVLLHRFSTYLFTFAAQNSGCNRKHGVEQRCARWLLLVHDRVSGDVLRLTHEFVSQMLGVRRASVTEALGRFEERGMVRTRRGAIEIADRTALEDVACECYGIINSSVRIITTGAPGPSPLDRVETARDGMSIVGDGTPLVDSTDDLTPQTSSMTTASPKR